MLSEKELEQLCFECQLCGQCCKGGSGYVRLSLQEAKKIALHLDLSLGDFLDHYTVSFSIGKSFFLSLKEDAVDGSCIFLKNNHCQIYPFRPFQCQSYPYWLRILESLKTWDNEKKYCRGIGKGAKVDKEKVIEYILKQRQEQLENGK